MQWPSHSICLSVISVCYYMSKNLHILLLLLRTLKLFKEWCCSVHPATGHIVCIQTRSPVAPHRTLVREGGGRCSQPSAFLSPCIPTHLYRVIFPHVFLLVFRNSYNWKNSWLILLTGSKAGVVAYVCSGTDSDQAVKVVPLTLYPWREWSLASEAYGALWVFHECLHRWWVLYKWPRLPRAWLFVPMYGYDDLAAVPPLS